MKKRKHVAAIFYYSTNVSQFLSLELIEKNATTFSFQNIANKGIAQKLLLEL